MLLGSWSLPGPLLAQICVKWHPYCRQVTRNIWMNYEGRRPEFTTRKRLWLAPWTRQRGEAPSAILAKPLSDCVTILCLSEAMQLKAFESLWNFEKKKCYFQTNWISCILNWGVRCDVVSDADHTCCCCYFLLTFPPPNWRTSLTTKIGVSIRQQT